MAMQAQECCCEISTHAPAGGATVFRSAPLLKRSPFLLTPLREGRRKQDLHRVVRVRISTHAPAGGATFPRLTEAGVENISTHAPAGGATR